MVAYFVTGTDTGVGKTRVSCALMHALQQAGHRRVVGMKPVAAGCQWVAEADGQAGHWLNEDVAALRQAASLQVPPGFDNPYALGAAVAPHIAAWREGVEIDLDHLVLSFEALRQRADAVVVEGAGGFLVPLGVAGENCARASNADGQPPWAAQQPTRWTSSADVAQRLALPVVLVVGLRLGCLNHALLTQEAILARGLSLAGWVANVVDADMQELDANIDTLRQHLLAPMWARFEWCTHASVQSLGAQMVLPALARAVGVKG